MTDTAAQQKIGRGMIWGAWIVLLGLLTWFFADWIERENNPNARPVVKIDEGGRAGVVLQRNRNGHYVLTATSPFCSIPAPAT